MATGIITRCIEKRLDDMGLNELERPNCQELRTKARDYYLNLISEEPDNDSIDDCEGIVLGFVAGYEACLNARES